MKSSDFWTRPKSEEGVRLPLMLVTGAESGYWLVIIGRDSEAFEKAMTALNAALLAARALPDPAAMEAATKAAILECKASFVVGWNFDDAFTHEGALDLMRNAPQIANRVDEAVVDVRRFFGPASTASSPGQRSSDDSEVAVESNSAGVLATH